MAKTCHWRYSHSSCCYHRNIRIYAQRVLASLYAILPHPKQLCTHNNDKCDPQRFPTPKTGDARAAYSRLILDFPVDVLLEVGGYLDEIALMSLAVTCKKLKKLWGDGKACKVWSWLRTGKYKARCVPIDDLQPWARRHLSNIAFTRLVGCDFTKKRSIRQKNRLFAYLEGSKHVPWDALADKLMSRQQIHSSLETLEEITEFLIRNGANRNILEQWIKTRAKQINDQVFWRNLQRVSAVSAVPAVSTIDLSDPTVGDAGGRRVICQRPSSKDHTEPEPRTW
jgi:hypothetical protein